MTAASHAGAVVLTFDEHFRQIDRVGACGPVDTHDESDVSPSRGQGAVL